MKLTQTLVSLAQLPDTDTSQHTQGTLEPMEERLPERRVLASVTQGMVFAATFHGVELRDAVREAGLSAEQLADRDAYVDLDQHVRLGLALIDRSEGRPLGLHMGMMATLSLLGPLGYVLGGSATLEEALGHFVRYQGFLTNAWSWASIRDEDGISFEVVEADPELLRIAHPLEAYLAGWVSIARQLTGEQVNPGQVSFPHRALADPSDHERFFGCPVRFEAPKAAASFSAQQLQLPIRGANESFKLEMQRQVERVLQRIDPERTGFGSEVRQRVLAALPQGVPAQRTIARELGVTERTLQRRLEREDTSFSEVVDAARRQLAERLLQNPALSVGEVAFLVGFGEPSTFYRAFRRWNGTTPARFRALAS